MFSPSELAFVQKKSQSLSKFIYLLLLLQLLLFSAKMAAKRVTKLTSDMETKFTFPPTEEIKATIDMLDIWTPGKLEGKTAEPSTGSGSLIFWVIVVVVGIVITIAIALCLAGRKKRRSKLSVEAPSSPPQGEQMEP